MPVNAAAQSERHLSLASRGAESIVLGCAMLPIRSRHFALSGLWLGRRPKQSWPPRKGACTLRSKHWRQRKQPVKHFAMSAGVWRRVPVAPAWLLRIEPQTAACHGCQPRSLHAWVPMRCGCLGKRGSWLQVSSELDPNTRKQSVHCGWPSFPSRMLTRTVKRWSDTTRSFSQTRDVHRSARLSWKRRNKLRRAGVGHVHKPFGRGA